MYRSDELGTFAGRLLVLSSLVWKKVRTFSFPQKHQPMIQTHKKEGSQFAVRMRMRRRLMVIRCNHVYLVNLKPSNH